MRYDTLADAVLICHVVYIAIVILGVPLIIIGKFKKWQWVHNIWFRGVHLFMIAIVVFENLFSIRCPLTVWENLLRADITKGDKNQDFIAFWLDRLIFYHFPYWAFTLIYAMFGLLVLSLFFIVPIKPVRKKRVMQWFG